MCRKSIRQHKKDIALSAKNNPKKFWKFAIAKSKTKTSIPDLYNMGDKTTLTNSDVEKANVLRDFFPLVFTADPQGST